MLALKKTLPHGGPSRQAGFMRSPGLVDRGDAGTFTRASTATAPDHNGKYRQVLNNMPGIWGSTPKPNFLPLSSVTLSSPPSSQQFFWNYRISGNYLYAASHTNGCDIFDISTPGSISHAVNVRMKTPAGVTSGMPCTDVIIIGTTLFMCGRSINFTTPAPGYITTYDITTPTSPSFLATFEDTTPDLNPWYQGMDTDGTYLYVASQYDGVFVFDISNPAALSIHGSNSSGSWETSRLVVHNGYLYCANHGFGMRILDIATPATPGAVTDRSIAALVVTNGVVTDTMRVRNLTADGNYLYCAPNVSTADGDSPLRGLLVLDITDPTTVPTDGSTWVHTAISADDVDTWNSQGDKPIMGISTKLKDFIYLPNGQRGSAIFDVSDPTTPVYMGLTGNAASGTNLYQTLVTTISGVDYAFYGSGAEVPASQTHTLYVDKIYYGAERHANSKGLLLEGAATNLVASPFSPATQDVTVGTGNYTVSMDGGGSVAVAAGTAVGTGFGNATDGTPLTINISSGGTISLTITGECTALQCESGAFHTSFVEGTRALHSFLIPGPYWFKPNNICGYLEFTPHSAAAVASLGEQALFDLVVGSDQFKCYVSNSGGGKAWVRKVTGGGSFTGSTGQNFTPVAGTKVRIAWKLAKGVGMKIWVDGALGGPGITDDSDITITGNARIGARSNGTFPCYGAIANMKIWPYALSDTFLAGYGA